MSNNMDVFNNSNDFFTHIMNESFFSKDKWFQMSYKTFQRTLRTAKINSYQEKKEIAKKIVFDTMQTINLENYNLKLSNYFEKMHTLDIQYTIGRSQKLLNILTKYFYTYMNTNNLDSHQLISNNFPALNDKDFIKICHIPIDNIVLDKLKEYQISKDFLKPPEGVWSKLNTSSWYFEFQNQVKSIANKCGMSPIDFELCKLWVVPIKN